MSLTQAPYLPPSRAINTSATTILVMEMKVGGIIDVTTFEYTLDDDMLTTVSYDGTIESTNDSRQRQLLST